MQICPLLLIGADVQLFLGKKNIRKEGKTERRKEEEKKRGKENKKKKKKRKEKCFWDHRSAKLGPIVGAARTSPTETPNLIFVDVRCQKVSAGEQEGITV